MGIRSRSGLRFGGGKWDAGGVTAVLLNIPIIVYPMSTAFRLDFELSKREHIAIPSYVGNNLKQKMLQAIILKVGQSM